MSGSLLFIRTKFDDELWERRNASVKTENLGTKVLQIGFTEQYLGFEFSKTIELRVRYRNFRSSRPSMQLVFDALPFYSSKDFDKFDTFTVLFKLDSIILQKNPSYNYPPDHSFNQICGSFIQLITFSFKPFLIKE